MIACSDIRRVWIAFLLLATSATTSHAQPPALAQDYTVVFHNPDSERYVEGPGIVRLDDGALVAVVPVVPRNEWSAERRAMQSRAHILRSTDGGKTWQPASELPYYSAVPWTHRGTLYLFANKGGTKSRNDDLLLLRSSDGGTTWSEPVTLFTRCRRRFVRRPDEPGRVAHVGARAFSRRA
jgi:hypothetical protein